MRTCICIYYPGKKRTGDGGDSGALGVSLLRLSLRGPEEVGLMILLLLLKKKEH